MFSFPSPLSLLKFPILSGYLFKLKKIFCTSVKRSFAIIFRRLLLIFPKSPEDLIVLITARDLREFFDLIQTIFSYF